MAEVFLTLENGQVFTGRRFGAAGDVTGELVFTTSMLGYLEMLTDPGYYGQIVVQTFPSIGNYGVIPTDFESASPLVKAYVVREWCQEPSNFRCEGDLDAFLCEQGVVGLYGIDTRALTRLVRDHGTMNARISDAPITDKAELEALAAHRVENGVAQVTVTENGSFKTSDKRVALWDFGAKASLRRELEKRGCEVAAISADTTAAAILEMKPDGVVLSDGPGNPAENAALIGEIQKLLAAKIPVFGIGLGHQMMALAQGAQVEKMKHGHRGGNIPARDVTTGRIYITAQSHGYVVKGESLQAGASVSHVNVNDSSCEGIVYQNIPAFSVQFTPDAAKGELYTGELYDRFAGMLTK